MKTTIDRAGRIVVPKPLREALGLTGGEALGIEERDGHLEISVEPTPMRLEERDGLLVAVPQDSLPPLTNAVVRSTLERVRR